MGYPPDTIVITGIGMISSIGLDVVTSCAAARASIARAAEVDTYTVFNKEEMEPENIIGHEIQSFTQGFEGVGRLVRMGLAAFEDLVLSSSDIIGLGLKKTGFWLSLPDVTRIYERLHEDSDNKDEDREEDSSEEETIDLGVEVSRRLLELMDLNIPSTNNRAFYSGHNGVIRSIHEVTPLLKSGDLKSCIIGGVDSLLEEETLEWLNETKRLKTSERPAGLIPGEAGTFILIERYDSAVKRKAEMHAVIKSSALGEENDSLLKRNPTAGVGLSSTIADALEKTEDKNIGLIIGDHNGETYRASDWGNAIMRLSMKYPDIEKVPVWYPADSFGDTFAASGGVSVCMAVRGFARNYAKTDSILICSSADNGDRGAVCLGRYRVKV